MGRCSVVFVYVHRFTWWKCSIKHILLSKKIIVSNFMCFSNFYHYILISICTAMHACAHYAEVLSQIETLHPDLKDTLSLKGLSIQAQDRYLLWTALEQRGEQTVNRDGKTSGGVRNVASSSSSALKWPLNM